MARRKASIGSRLKGLGRMGLGGLQVGLATSTFGATIGPGVRNIRKGGRQAFQRRDGRSQPGHPFYGNQYVKIGKRGGRNVRPRSRRRRRG